MDNALKVHLSSNFRKITKGEKIFIYNSLSGGGLVVNQDGMEIIKLISNGLNPGEINEIFDAPALDAFVSNLIEKNLLFERQEKRDKLEYFFNEKFIRSGGLVRNLRLNITEACNLNCTYCFEKNLNGYGKNRMMTWPTAKKSLTQFMDLISKNNHRDASIRFFGGEPLLNWPLMEKCLKYVKEKIDSSLRISFIVNTNGTLITDQLARKLSKYGVDVNISLDGLAKYNDKFRKFKSGEGSFKKTDNGIDLLIKNKCRFGIAAVLSDQNYSHIEEFIDYCADKISKSEFDFIVGLTPICRVERTCVDSLPVKEKVKYLVSAVRYARQKGIYLAGGMTHFTLKRIFTTKNDVFYCGGVGSELTVDPAGTVFPCSALDIKLGSIENLNDVFNSNQYKKLVSRTVGNIKHCRRCDIEYFCAGGCAADAATFGGDIFGPIPDCDFKKLLFKELIKEQLLS